MKPLADGKEQEAVTQVLSRLISASEGGKVTLRDG